MKDKHRRGLFAVFAVMMMAVVVFAPCAGSEDSEAAFGVDEYYKYTMTTSLAVTDSSGTAMTAISRTSDWNINAGSWGFNADGYGPFNSYYAAINPNTGKVLCHLNPNNLAQSIDGKTTVDGVAISNCNIMWVLPTVYIGLSGSNLVMSNESFSGSQAYAHTIDGHTYKYLALGVYEGNLNGSNLMSQSGKSPLVNTTLINLRDYANNNTVDGGHAMLWNWYQYELYRICSLAVMESFDSQTTVGYGACDGSEISAATGITSGQLNAAPYSGSSAANAKGVKLFIENAWGGVFEYLDDCYWNNGVIYAGQNIAGQSTGTSLSSWSGGTSTGYTAPSSGYGYGCSSNLKTWGMPTSSQSGVSTTAPDYIYKGTFTSFPALLVGGYWYHAGHAGLSSVNYHQGVATSDLGSRLAMVFDADPAAPKSVKLNYDALSTAGASADMIANLPTKVTIDEDGSSTYPDLSSLMGEYAHMGWYVDGVLVQPGSAITKLESHTAYIACLPPSITITFMVEGIQHSHLNVTKGSVGVVYVPDRVSGVFMGWYYDAVFTQKYDAVKPLNEDTTLYAKGVMPLEFTSVPSAVATITNVDASGLFYFDATDSDGCYSVHWDFGDGNTSDDRIAYNQYSEPGNYTVTLTVTNANGQSDVKTYHVDISEEEPDDGVGYGVYVLIIGTVLVGALAIRRVL